MATVEVTVPRIGVTTNITGFSVQEDATPIDPSSSLGGVGTITFGLREEGPDYPLMIGGVVLADGSRGKTSGVVRSTSSTDGTVQVVADSIMNLFNTDKTIPPYVGTLGGAVSMLRDLVGIPNNVTVESSITGRSVTLPGGRGNVWVRFKQLMAAQQVEAALVFNRIYVRPLRTIEASMDRVVSHGWTVGNDQAAQSVEVNYYPTTTGTQLEVYPVLQEDPQIIVVDAGETQVIQQTLSASLWSVNQPQPLLSVENRPYPGTNGVYSIVGVDDKPVVPAQWTGAGGALTVRVTDNPSVIEIEVRGANIPHLSPFRIAMSSGAGNYYNSLHITGNGVGWETNTVRIPTGVSPTVSSVEVGVTVDNPCIQTLAQAYTAGFQTAKAYSGLQYEVSGSAFALNRKGDDRDLISPAISDFNSAMGFGTPISTFNTQWSGQTIAQFNTAWQSQFESLWENQLFGNAPGARILERDCNFRITSTTTTETSVQYTAEYDTTIGDFNARWPSSQPRTIAAFNAQFAGYTCKDFSVVPLRRD